jgi:acyl-CoA thioesterase FadM
VDGTALPVAFEAPFVVRFDEAGADGALRASGYLRFAQHVAWMHSTAAGFDRAWYGERGLTWLVRALELERGEAVPYGSEIVVTTEVTAFRRSWARRRSRFLLGAERREIARATIDWLLLGSGGRPVRIPAEIDGAFGRLLDERPALRVDLPEPPAGSTRVAFPVREHELDPMKHVNNAVYLDYLEEGVAAAGGAADLAVLPRAYSLEYAFAAEPGALLEATVYRDGPAWCYRLATAGRESLRGRMTPGS